MNISLILEAKYPEVNWAVAGNTYEGIEWLDESPMPTLEELEEAWPEVEYAAEKAKVQEARRQAYVMTADPLFFGWQRGDNTEQEWLDAVQAVKDANPYPAMEDLIIEPEIQEPLVNEPELPAE